MLLSPYFTEAQMFQNTYMQAFCPIKVQQLLTLFSFFTMS